MSYVSETMVDAEVDVAAGAAIDGVCERARAAKAGSRCWECRRKISVTTSFVCKCGRALCASHRFPEDHACPFDHKAASRKVIEMQNPVVMAAKVDRI